MYLFSSKLSSVVSEFVDVLLSVVGKIGDVLASDVSTFVDALASNGGKFGDVVIRASFVEKDVCVLLNRSEKDN